MTYKSKHIKNLHEIQTFLTQKNSAQFPECQKCSALCFFYASEVPKDLPVLKPSWRHTTKASTSSKLSSPHHVSCWLRCCHMPVFICVCDVLFEVQTNCAPLMIVVNLQTPWCDSSELNLTYCHWNAFDITVFPRRSDSSTPSNVRPVPLLAPKYLVNTVAQCLGQPQR